MELSSCFIIIWLTAKYTFTRVFVPANAAIDALMVLFASIALAALQSIFAKEQSPPPIESEAERATRHKERQRRRKAERHP